ncbi:MAG: BrnA antitoxin family protein [Treponema sp.]|nr:BrnA antitoxin family protein [Treponema sp.]
MRTVSYTIQTLPKVSKEEWKKVDAIKDEDIDCSEIQEFNDTSNFHPWQDRKLFKPIKVSVTCKLDADIVAWLKQGGKGYQTRLNSILRKVMLHAL